MTARITMRSPGLSARTLAAKLLVASAVALSVTGCKTTDDPTRVAGWTLIDSSQRHPILVSQEPSLLPGPPGLVALERHLGVGLEPSDYGQTIVLAPDLGLVPGKRYEVVLRAGNRCEYCGLSQIGQEATFHVDHVIPRVADGPTTADNLALACVSCSLRKWIRQTAPDPDTGEVVPLFNPRTQTWADTFRWEGLKSCR